MKYLAIVLLLLLSATSASIAQDIYFTDQGHVDFFSTAPVEDIKADNDRVTSFLKTNGNLVFAVPIRSFEFKKSLMQEHFNEKYMQTDSFPQATFKGTITNINDVDFSTDGVYNVVVMGDLNIHGVTKPYKVNGTIEVKQNQLIAKAKFPVTLKDHNIDIPKLLIQKIAEVVEVTVDINYVPYNKSASN